MSPFTPDEILYLVPACITTVAGMAAVSLDQFQRRAACAFAALGAVSPWLFVAMFVVPLRFQLLSAPFLWSAVLGGWAFFMLAALDFMAGRDGRRNRRAAAASLVGMFAAGVTTLLAVVR